MFCFRKYVLFQEDYCFVCRPPRTSCEIVHSALHTLVAGLVWRQHVLVDERSYSTLGPVSA